MDFDALEQRIQEATAGNGLNPFSAPALDYEGMNPFELNADYECVFLAWLEANTPFTYETFATMSAHKGTCGLIAYKANGDVFREIKVDVTGNNTTAKIQDRIAEINKIIVLEVVRFVYEN